MRRVDVAVEKADCDAGNAFAASSTGPSAATSSSSSFTRTSALRVEALAHGKAEMPRHQRRRLLHEDVVLLEAALGPHLDGIAEPLSGDQRGRAPLRSISALVASVVPWITRSRLAKPIAALARTASIAVNDAALRGAPASSAPWR